MHHLRMLGLCFALVLAPPAVAQDDDRGRLTRFIESQLSSGADRQVRIDGFRGALSSEATLERLTISDADGPWLILEEAQLNWRRAALLTGALEIEALRAENLRVLRPPLPPEGPQLPSPEATPFSLPELPVSVNIGQIAIARLELGEALLGQEAALSISGMARLAGGSGAVDIAADRLDGPEGRFSVNANFANDTRILGIDLILQEAPGGLAATLLNLPGAPDLRLEVAGEGPLDDIEVAIALATEGTDRVTGSVRSARLGEEGTQQIDLDLSGDLTPLMAEEYRPFFGTDSILAAEVRRDAEGATELSDLRLTGAAFDLRGDVSLDPQSRPQRFQINARIANPAGDGPVRLPVAGEAELGRAMLDLGFDAAAGEEFRLDALLSDLRVADATIAAASITANGQITPTETGIGAVTSEIAATLSGLAHTDPGLAGAMGDTAVLGAQIAWAEGEPLVIDDLSLRGAGLSADGRITAGLGGNELPLGFDLVADVEDISRFSGLAGQDVRGAVDAALAGSAEALSGAFDISLVAQSRDLSVGDVLPPEILAGDSEIRVDAVRDGEGTRIDGFSLRAAGVTAEGRMAAGAGGEDLPLSFDLVADVESLARFSSLAGQNLQGAIDASLSGTADAQSGAFEVSLEGQARDLRIGNAVPPELLAGQTDLRLAAARSGEDIRIDVLTVDGQQVRLSAEGGLGTGGSGLEATARLADLGLFSTAVRGPATLTADVNRAAEGWRVNAGLQGPAGLTGNVAGLVGLPDGSVDLGARGSVPLELANRFIAPQSLAGPATFDMTLRGAPSLQAVSGRLSTSGARLAVPAAQLALTEIGLSANLQGGRVSLDGGGNVSSGGAREHHGRRRS
jgi:translocation and assembly module TamB